MHPPVWKSKLRRPRHRTLVDSTQAYGNYARLQAFAAAAEHPDRVDAACVNGGGNSEAACTVPLPQCQKYVEDFNSGLGRGANVGGWAKRYDAYRRAKYLLNLPGAYTGSYSKNANHLWRTGGVFLRWVAPYVEWYHPALVHGENYLDVSRHSVAATVDALEANPTAAEAIGRAGRDIHDAFLCPVQCMNQIPAARPDSLFDFRTGPMCLVRFLKTTLEAYHEHLGLGLVLDDPAEASKFFRAHLPCDILVDARHPSHQRRAPQPIGADDPIHPCRPGGPAPNDGWRADSDLALERLRRAEAGGMPLTKAHLKPLGLRKKRPANVTVD